MSLTKQFIKEKLLTDDRWLVRGILAIYNLQTDQEKAAEATLKHNGVGFNGCDAYILSSFAKQLQAGRTLSYNQLYRARIKMQKYAGQLLAIAKSKGGN